ncbi:MAG: YceD family protein [Acidimicrobiia bacterium]|nr:YceD family protein [Acidimicrobiia bacterium]
MNTPFTFHIGDMRSGRAEPRTISGEVSVDWHVELSRVQSEPPLFFEFRLEAVAGGIAVTGTIEARVLHRCYRCLIEWEEPVLREVRQLITTVADEEEEADYRLDGDVFDFESVVRDELLLDLPIAPRCGPDCEGLVDAAGSDLNTSLSEDERGENSPFSVLKDLLDTGD